MTKIPQQETQINCNMPQIKVVIQKEIHPAPKVGQKYVGWRQEKYPATHTHTNRLSQS